MGGGFFGLNTLPHWWMRKNARFSIKKKGGKKSRIFGFCRPRQHLCAVHDHVPKRASRQLEVRGSAARGAAAPRSDNGGAHCAANLSIWGWTALRSNSGASQTSNQGGVEVTGHRAIPRKCSDFKVHYAEGFFFKLVNDGLYGFFCSNFFPQIISPN